MYIIASDDKTINAKIWHYYQSKLGLSLFASSNKSRNTYSNNNTVRD